MALGSLAFAPGCAGGVVEEARETGSSVDALVSDGFAQPPDAFSAGESGPSPTDAAAPSDACTPQCAGKVCGPDGCGGQCGPGCADGSTCSPEGLCQMRCATWRLDQPGVRAGQVALDPQSRELYAVGEAGNGGWVAAIDACEGRMLRSVRVTAEASTTSALFTLQLDGPDHLLVAGQHATAADPQDGLYARLTRDLEALWIAPIAGSAAIDDVQDLVVTEAGTVWMTGSLSAAPDAWRPWRIKGDAEGQVCGSEALPGAGLGRAIAADGAAIYLALTSGGTARVLRFAEEACPVAAPCDCPAAWTSNPIAVGATYTEPRDLLVEGERIWMAGFAADDDPPTDYYGFVVALDAGTGAISATFKWNPTAQIDAFATLQASADTLYVAGLQGWAGQEDFAGAASALLALPKPLQEPITPRWETTLGETNVIVSLALEPAPGDGLLGFARADRDSVAFRCTQGGRCP